MLWNFFTKLEILSQPVLFGAFLPATVTIKFKRAATPISKVK